MSLKKAFLSGFSVFIPGFFASISAFDYLEHSVFTDRACHEAQLMLSRQLRSATADQKSRYLALALMCPTRWQPEYCSGKKKVVSAGLSIGARQNGGHPVTLGDYSALVDHITEYGRVRKFPGASERGLADLTWKWLQPTTIRPGGVAGDIAEAECRLDGAPDWYKVESDISGFFRFWQKEKRAPRLATPLLEENRRQEIAPGPSDPSAYFTIKNPRFLDLQLFNQTHFGAAAYRTWAGLHTTAIALAGMRCEEAIDPDESILRRLSEKRPQFAQVSWDKKKNRRFHRLACELMGEIMRERLIVWQQQGDERLTIPAKAILASIAGDKTTAEGREILDALPVHVAALVFEGVGAHFLQDALSGGHIRTEHKSRELNTTRRYHDIDSQNGVVATLAGRQNRHDFVAFGDTYLLGVVSLSMVEAQAALCESSAPRFGSVQTTNCLLGYQRGIVTAANAASILDWSLGGVMYQPQNTLNKPNRSPECPLDGSPRALICAFLPLQAITPAANAGANTGYLAREGLPPTPPPVDFESLRIESALDGAGYGTQIGARLEFLTPFKRRGGDWLYSYDFGFLMTLGDPGRQQLIHEFAFTFHYRFATRLLMSAGPLTYAGFEGFNSTTNFFFGTGLGAGITILPEGWTKIPLELTLSYRAPWRFVDTNRGFDAQRVEAHWIALSIGLAFL